MRLAALHNDRYGGCMTTLLDVPAIRELVSPLSVAEYHQLGEFNENGRRTELLRGYLLEKMSKSPLHRFTADLLRDLLTAQVGPGFVIFSQDPLTTADSEPEPDVMVVRGERTDFQRVHPTTAELVVEVAVTSLEVDRAKADIYAEAGVKEYWIVCPERKCVEVYREPTPLAYEQRTIVAAPAVLAPASLPGIQVDLAALFAGA
jgi:Uma2 family endonuclease